MNKLLRNPWMVSALVIGMAAVWWVQLRAIVQPDDVAESSSPVFISAEPVHENLPTDASSTVPQVAQVPRVASQLRWDNTPSRDPFGPPTTSVPVSKEVPVTPAPVLPMAAPPPALEAVLNTPSAHIAVIDGRIVRVGDTVSGRAVLRIDNASVALSRALDESQPLVLKLPLQ